MDHYVGVDVSLKLSSVCVVDATGKIVKEVKVESDPEPLFLSSRDLVCQWRASGWRPGLCRSGFMPVTEAGFETVLLETRHVKAALSAMTVKTDRKDARGIAQLIRMGWFRPVHAKSFGSQEIRALLVARKQLLGKLTDVELSYARHFARVRFEDGHGDAQGLRGACPRTRRRPGDVGTDHGAMLSARATFGQRPINYTGRCWRLFVRTRSVAG